VFFGFAVKHFTAVILYQVTTSLVGAITISAVKLVVVHPAAKNTVVILASEITVIRSTKVFLPSTITCTYV